MNHASTAKISAAAGSAMDTCRRHGLALIPGETVELYGKRYTAPSICPACEQERDAKDAAQDARQREERFRRQQVHAGVSPRFAEASLDAFITETPAQRDVLAVLRRFVETGGTDPANLILAGTLGPGKTFVGYALVNFWLRAGRSAIFTTALGLVRRIRDTYSSTEKEGAVMRRLASVGLLVIDECGVKTGSPSERALLADVINSRYENVRPTAVIGNLTAGEFTEALGERAMDRLKEKGRTLIFDWASRRGKA